MIEKWQEEREEWCKKYGIPYARGGFREKYFLPKHVLQLSSNREGFEGPPLYGSFDGTAKTWEQLTEEEKQDYKQGMGNLEEALKTIEKRHQEDIER